MSNNLTPKLSQRSRLSQTEPALSAATALKLHFIASADKPLGITVVYRDDSSQYFTLKS